MQAILKVLLLWTHLLHFKHCSALNSSVLAAANATALPIVDFMAEPEDTKVMKVQDAALPVSIPTSIQQSQQSTSLHRNDRQLFYDPNLIFVPQNLGGVTQGFGFSGYEGAKCITARGLPGVCMRFGSCGGASSYRYGRQLTAAAAAAFFTLRQWPHLGAPAIGQEICSFYDVYGRANTGVCCINQLGSGGNDGGFSFVPLGGVAPPRPVQPPPPEVVPQQPQPPNREETDERDTENMEDTEEIEAEDPSVPPLTGNEEFSPDFPDDNNVIYDTVKQDSAEQATPVTYDDFRYQWPPQFAGQFSAQWPPALPTHPPATASWPPPLPTHPPNHHYPTHPPFSGAVSKPPSTVLTTKRASTTSRPFTTTRRPFTTTRRPFTTTTRFPSYPNYPGYPVYPSYPSYRPPTSTTTTTTRRPSTGGASSSGTAANGLPMQCGIKNPETPDQERIVGGTNASPNEFPWIAVLFKSGKQFCGGSLITHNHILTAAHCVARMTSWDVAALTVHLGDYNIRTDFEVKHVERRIKRLVRHKGFEFSTLHNDVAILTLNEPVKFTYEIQPICLPTSTAQQSRSYSGQTATVVGWGSLRENGPQPSILQKVSIPIWTNSECARKYGNAAPGGIIESMICAGQTARDSCSLFKSLQGDSGGPMIVHEGGRYTQVGLVSWGIGCGKGQYPGVYTRVTSLLPWIYKNIK